MHAAAVKFKQVVRSEHSDREQAKREKESRILSQQVLELNDKFDYFVCMMIRAKKMRLKDVSQTNPQQKPNDYSF